MGRCRGGGAINRGLIALISLARCLTHSLGRSLPIVCYETAFLPPVPPSPFPLPPRGAAGGGATAISYIRGDSRRVAAAAQAAQLPP